MSDAGESRSSSDRGNSEGGPSSGGFSGPDSGGWGGGRGNGGGNITDLNQSAAETARLAALEAKTQAPAKSDWDRFVENSPTFSQAAKLAFGVFSSPITGMVNAARFNSARLENMSPADIANERAVQAEIEANRRSHDAGSDSNRTYGGLQFGNAKIGTVSSVGSASGGSGFITGGLGSGGEMVGSSQGGKTAAGGGTGTNGLVAGKDSPLGELAALATIAAVMLQIMG